MKIVSLDLGNLSVTEDISKEWNDWVEEESCNQGLQRRKAVPPPIILDLVFLEWEEWG